MNAQQMPIAGITYVAAAEGRVLDLIEIVPAAVRSAHAVSQLVRQSWAVAVESVKPLQRLEKR